MLAKSINRSAVLCWNPKFEENLTVACGSKISPNSRNSCLEIFELSSEKPVELVSIDIPSSFNRIIWTSIEANFKDLIIGAFENGKVEVYNSQTLLSAESDGIIKVPSLHSGSVKGLCLSKFQPNLIVSGSINGEIALWDLYNLEKASILNIEKSSKFGNVSDMSWNPKVPHIISAASDTGIVSIIDLRAKREITTLTLMKNEGAASCTDWHPEVSTNILISSDSDSQPFAYLFDLRNPGSAQNIFKGHSDGILSLSWSQKDPDMVLSSGNDGRILRWNPNTGEILNEYSYATAFDVQWCPNNQNVFCVSTLENGIFLHSINDLENEKNNDSLTNGMNDVSPQLLNCPIGAYFGGNNSCSIFRSSSRQINIIKPKINFIYEFYNDLLQFESELNQNTIRSICLNIVESETDNGQKRIWKLISLLGSDNFRTDLIDLIEESCGELDDCNNLFNMPDLNSLSNSVNLPDTFTSEIIDKIIKSDFDGAVAKCLELQLFSDALFISYYGGKELREKTEDLISQKKDQFYLSLVKSIGRNEFEFLVNTSPIIQWRSILKSLLLHVKPENLPALATILFLRLMEQGMELPALFVVILTRDCDKIVDIFLKRMFSDAIFSNFDSDSFDSIFKAYKFLKILEINFPNYIEFLKNTENKTIAFEVVTKIKTLLSSFGLDNKFVCNFQGGIHYENNISSNNNDFDDRLANLSLNISHNEMLPVVPTFVSNSPINNIKPFLSTSSPLKTLSINNQSTLSWQSPKGMYNDAPIVNPKLSKLSPQLVAQEINPETVQRAFKCLSDTVYSKSLPETTYRIVSDCFKRLTKDSICAKTYSNLSKASIIALFEELSFGNFDSAASLVANILSSFFGETKDWILPLKRLIDIIKN